MAQWRAFGHDIEENTKTARQLIREAKQSEADMVLFPECFLTSYQFPAVCGTLPPLEEVQETPEFQAWKDHAIGEDDSHLEQIRCLARDLRIGVTITAFSKGHDLPQNSAWLIGRGGEILLKYSKVHTCDFSLERFPECGRGFDVCTFDDVKIGLMICYDREYPRAPESYLEAIRRYREQEDLGKYRKPMAYWRQKMK